MPGRNIEIICGYHAVRHVLSERPHDVLDIFIAQNRKQSARVDALQAACNDASIPVQHISPVKLNRLADIKNHQGIAARCRKIRDNMRTSVADLCAGNRETDSIILVLDRVMDPHNLGACIRTADAAGAHAVIIPRDHSAPLNATVKKAASGATETIDVITVTNIARSLRQLRDSGYAIIGTAGDADNSIYETEVTFPLVLVMGPEQKGLRHNTREHCDRLVNIPMHGSVESLNLSVAAGICLYEIRRRVKTTGK
ncbi:MAG: 23S rRNA (guanosine(2251)-2'-O)-methyltransferase RlmB [Gammaproteobacteria bacterium]|nr:23S rRNA (guanosine(2251)-2'-O)-methyltransferase RlmB [Gammaproteobacteria bacterium]